MRLLCKIFTGIILLPLVLLAGDNGVEFPVKELRLPIERYENGLVKVLLYAREAKVPTPGGKLEGRGIVIEQFAPDGVTVEMRVEADDCIYDRAEEKGVCRGRVLVRTRGLLIRGVGLEWSRKDEMVSILSDAQIECDRKLIPMDRITL